MPPSSPSPVAMPTSVTGFDLPQALQRPMTRGCVAASVAAVLGCVVALAALPGTAPALLRVGLAGALLVHGALCAAAWRASRDPARPADRCVFHAGAGVAGVSLAAAVL